MLDVFRKAIFSIPAAGLLLVSGYISAGVIDTGAGYCVPITGGSSQLSTTLSASNLGDVTITSAENTSTNSQILPSGFSISATNCAGVFNGNDNPAGSNTGFKNDGLLNGENQSGGQTDTALNPNTLFDGGAFISSADWSNLEGDALADDPGWVKLWKKDIGSNGNFEDFTTVLGAGFKLEDYMSIETSLTSGKAGTWELSFLDPTGLLEALAETAFGDSYFDHLALGFKSAQDELVFYDFDFNIINNLISGSGLEVDLNTPHNFSGTFDLSWQDHDISHISFFARDPVDPINEIPEPTSLFLIVLGMLGLVLIRNHKTVPTTSILS